MSAYINIANKSVRVCKHSVVGGRRIRKIRHRTQASIEFHDRTIVENEITLLQQTEGGLR